MIDRLDRIDRALEATMYNIYAFSLMYFPFFFFVALRECCRSGAIHTHTHIHKYTHIHYELILLIIKEGKRVREIRIVLSNKRGRHGFQCFHYD